MRTFKQGEAIRVRLNEDFELSLPVLAAAGYQWEVAEKSPELALMKTSFQTGGGSHVGGASQQVLQLHSDRPGTHRLRLVCKRPWDATPGETLDVQVAVKP